MSAPAVLILFDDRAARTWEPFALTRPVGELLFGARTQRARAEQALSLPFGGYLGCPELAGFEEPGAGHVLAEPYAPASGRLYLCSRAVPGWGLRPNYPEVPAAVEIGGRLAGWYAPPGTPAPSPEFLLDLLPDRAPLERIVVPGRWLDAVWDLIDRNPWQVEEDFRALGGSGRERSAPHEFSAVGSPDGWFRRGRNVTIEPGVVFDFSAGPIWLDDDVVVRAFTRLAGPAYIGARSVLLGGRVSSVSIGPVCRVHGEVEGTVILGYGNKAHDGYLGHSYLGRWVNIGAQTINSNLKNNYGSVRVWTPAGIVDTGHTKLGCLLGDHVKTAIGTMIGTGTVVGAGSNLFGRESPGAFVPPFSWGSSHPAAYDVDRFLDAAAIAMSRREVTLSDDMRRMLRAAWRRGRAWAE